MRLGGVVFLWLVVAGGDVGDDTGDVVRAPALHGQLHQLVGRLLRVCHLGESLRDDARADHSGQAVAAQHQPIASSRLDVGQVAPDQVGLAAGDLEAGAGGGVEGEGHGAGRVAAVGQEEDLLSVDEVARQRPWAAPRIGTLHDHQARDHRSDQDPQAGRAAL